MRKEVERVERWSSKFKVPGSASRLLMWEPPQRGDRERKRVSSFQDSTLTQIENDGPTPIAIDDRPFGTCSLIGSDLSGWGHFSEAPAWT